jgi:hypothetical protein
VFTYVDIANLALGFLGEDGQLRSPDDDSHAASTIKAAWPLVRRICLRELTPSFAKRRREIPARPASSAEPVIGFDNAFALPGDCVRLLEIVGPAGASDRFHVEGRDILANGAGPLQILMIADIIATEQWDDLFVQAFANRLAYQIADRITSDLARQDRCWEAYRKAKNHAGAADARQDPSIPHEDSSWVTARWDAGYPLAPYAPPGYPIAPGN